MSALWEILDHLFTQHDQLGTQQALLYRCDNPAGPEKYGERGNGVPRKVGTYQEVKANLIGKP